MTYFTYNGRSSAEFGLHIEKKDVFSAPSYDAEFISIPGRSGDIINPNRRFSNIKVTYTVFLMRKNTAALTSRPAGYQGLVIFRAGQIPRTHRFLRCGVFPLRSHIRCAGY